MANQSIIETERTRIRPYTVADVARMVPILGDATTMQFWPQPLDEAAVARWVERAIDSFQQRGHGRMLVEDRHTSAAIGDCGVAWSEVNGRGEYDLGYIIHHPYWRQGYGLECARACLTDAAQRLGLQRIVANMAYDHIASQRVAEALGMQRETTFYNQRNRNKETYLYIWEG